MTDLLTQSNIHLRLRAATKQALLATLARLAAGHAALPEPAILAALTARESLGSTGVGNGIAMPHARIDGLTTPVTLLALLEKPVQYDAIDAAPVDIVFLLLTPPGAHLPLLAAAARRLREKSTAAALRAATTPEEALRAFA